MVDLSLPWKPIYTQSGGSSTEHDDTLFGKWALVLTIAFTIFVTVFEGYLDFRQKQSYKETTFPKQLETVVSEIDEERKKEIAATEKNTNESKKEEKEKNSVDPSKDDKEKTDHSKPLLPQLQDKFKAAQSYGMDKITFGMIATAYDVTESLTFLLIGFLPYLWDKSVELGSRFFGWTEVDNEIKISLIFLFLTTIIGTITSLPFEIYSTFQIERKHGFNKQTPGLFFTDKVKSLLLSFLIGGPFLALLLKIIKVGPHFRKDNFRGF